MMKKYLDQDPEEGLRGKLKLSNDGYTQREWDRTVGWGKVPDKYRRVSNTDKNAENTQRSDTSGETFKVPTEEVLCLTDPKWDERWTYSQKMQDELEPIDDE